MNARVLELEILRKKRQSIMSSRSSVRLDTIVVPAHNDQFEKMFMVDRRWAAVRVDKKKRGQLKYIAAYRTYPESAITHFAGITGFEPYPKDREEQKVIMTLSKPLRIGPIPLIKGGKIKPLRSSRYTNVKRLVSAKSLDELFRG